MDLDQIALDAAAAIDELAPERLYQPGQWKSLVQTAVLAALKQVAGPHFVMRTSPGATVERIWVDGEEYVLRSSKPDPASVPDMVQEFARRLEGTAAHWKAQGRHTCELGVMPIPEAVQLAAALRSVALPRPETANMGAVAAEVEVKYLTWPIIGIESRTAQEVFDIMSDRIRIARSPQGGNAVNAVKILAGALRRIERWFGEFPATGRFWDKEQTQEMSYSACHGSNGERDFMRGVARAALVAAGFTEGNGA